MQGFMKNRSIKGGLWHKRRTVSTPACCQYGHNASTVHGGQKPCVGCSIQEDRMSAYQLKFDPATFEVVVSKEGNEARIGLLPEEQKGQWALSARKWKAFVKRYGEVFAEIESKDDVSALVKALGQAIAIPGVAWSEETARGIALPESPKAKFAFMRYLALAGWLKCHGAAVG